MNHDRYEMDILKALQRIANSLDKIEKKMPDRSVKEYDTVKYGKENPDWVEKVNKIAGDNKKEFNKYYCSSLNRIAAASDGTCVDICDMACPYADKED